MGLSVIKPVVTCETCQVHLNQLRSLYAFYKACPGDPDAALEYYHRHHSAIHPLHPDMKGK